MSSVRKRAPLITHSSQMKNDRSLWFVLLNRAENVVNESSLIFKNWSTNTREKSSQREKWWWRSCLWGMGAPMIPHISQTNGDRNLQFLLLSRAKHVVNELYMIFKDWSTDTRGKPSQRQKWRWWSLLLSVRNGCTFDRPHFLNRKWSKSLVCFS